MTQTSLVGWIVLMKNNYLKLNHVGMIEIYSCINQKKFSLGFNYSLNY